MLSHLIGQQPTSAPNGVGWLVDLLDRWPWLQKEMITGVTVSRVIVAFLLILGSLVLGKIVRLVIEGYAKRLAEHENRTLLRLFLNCIAGPAYVVLFGVGIGLALEVLLARNDTFHKYAWQIGQAVIYVGIGWFIYKLVDIAEFYLNRLAARTETPLDDQLVPLLRKSLRVIIVIIVLLFIAQNVFNAQIGAMLAGLGIGGLAIALAAQDSISNFFGSITIFADRPFTVGDRVKIDDTDGIVQEVGFRSTKIRTLTGHLVTLPNSKLSNSAIENIGRRPFIRRLANITITYDTPPEKVERAVEIIREIIASTDHILHDEGEWFVAFNEFNDWSLNLIMAYKVSPPDWNLSLAVHQEVNLRMMREFAAEGIEFAFPTHTAYHKTEMPLLFRKEDGGEN